MARFLNDTKQLSEGNVSVQDRRPDTHLQKLSLATNQGEPINSLLMNSELIGRTY